MADERDRIRQAADGSETNGGPVYSGYPQPQPRSRLTLDRVIRFLLGAGVIAITAWLIWFFAALVIFLFVGIILAYLMMPLVDRLQGFGFGRIQAILATFVLVFGAIVLMITELAPFASSQIREFSEQITFQEAAQVTAVDPDGPAEEAGIAAGDLILEIQGQQWDGFSQLQSTIHARQRTDSLSVTVETREGERVVHVVELQIPQLDQEGQQVVTDEEDERYVAPLGLTAQEVTLSNVTAAIERRIRRIVPIERGAIMNSVALDRMFGEDQITAAAGSIVGVFTNIFYAVLVIPFVAFFFLKDETKIRRAMLRLVPNRYFELTLALVEKIETIIGRYFRALMLQICAVAIVASVMLYIIGLEYAVAVGVFTGLANTIPYFGPFMGFLAGTVVGIVQTGDFSMTPAVIVAMLVTQVADNVIFQPYIFSRAASTHPLLILFAVLIGAQVAGIPGMLVAIPVLTIIRVTVEQLLWSLRNYRILKAS